MKPVYEHCLSFCVIKFTCDRSVIINKDDHHEITEILLKVGLNTMNLNHISVLIEQCLSFLQQRWEDKWDCSWEQVFCLLQSYASLFSFYPGTPLFLYQSDKLWCIMEALGVKNIKKSKVMFTLFIHVLDTTIF